MMIIMDRLYVSVLKQMDSLWQIGDVIIKDKNVEHFYQTPPNSETSHQENVAHPSPEKSAQLEVNVINL